MTRQQLDKMSVPDLLAYLDDVAVIALGNCTTIRAIEVVDTIRDAIEEGRKIITQE